jgi:hypothetical protein
VGYHGGLAAEVTELGHANETIEATDNRSPSRVYTSPLLTSARMGGGRFGVGKPVILPTASNKLPKLLLRKFFNSCPQRRMAGFPAKLLYFPDVRPFIIV